MPDSSTLLLFALASAALVAVPGPNLVYIAARTLGEGRRAGVASVLGIETGTLVHLTAAAAGVSALVASSAEAFDALKYAGAAYLIFMGLRELLRGGGPAPADEARAPRLGRTYAEAVVVQLLNPKVALFFLAFFPQFLDPGEGTAGQVLVLGALFISIAVAIDLIYIVAVSALGARIGRGGRSGRRITGSVYLALGLVAALSPTRAKT